VEHQHLAAPSSNSLLSRHRRRPGRSANPDHLDILRQTTNGSATRSSAPARAAIN